MKKTLILTLALMSPLGMAANTTVCTTNLILQLSQFRIVSHCTSGNELNGIWDYSSSVHDRASGYAYAKNQIFKYYFDADYNLVSENGCLQGEPSTFTFSKSF